MCSTHATEIGWTHVEVPRQMRTQQQTSLRPWSLDSVFAQLLQNYVETLRSRCANRGLDIQRAAYPVCICANVCFVCGGGTRTVRIFSAVDGTVAGRWKKVHICVLPPSPRDGSKSLDGSSSNMHAKGRECRHCTSIAVRCAFRAIGIVGTLSHGRIKTVDQQSPENMLLARASNTRLIPWMELTLFNRNLCS